MTAGDQTPLDRFAEVVGTVPLRLDVAAALIAAHCNDADPSGVLEGLDRLAADVADPTPEGVIDLLFRDLGFTGDREHYYDPANSYLDEVLDRRRGIPITLSVLAIEVGRRVGVDLFGVGMPGHFLVGDRGDPDHFVDAYTGVAIDADGARRIFETMQPHAAFDPSFLDETPSASIVLRMLNNLRMIHHQARNTPSLVAVLELLVCLPDCPLDEYHQLSSALELLGRVDEAARYLDQAADRYGGSDADQLRSQATRLWAKLN